MIYETIGVDKEGSTSRYSIMESLVKSSDALFNDKGAEVCYLSL